MESRDLSDQCDWRNAESGSAGPVYLPVGIPAAFKTLIASAPTPEAASALRRQVEPTDAEHVLLPFERADPLGEARWCVTPHLVHQYRNRVLLLVTGRCLGYCRYCFRRNFTARSEGFIGKAELDSVCAYLASRPDVQEILISGGDPLSGAPGELDAVLDRIRSVRPGIILRLCTRAPVFAPELFTAERIAYFRSIRPLWLIPHINHPAELGPAQLRALSACIDAGIPVQSQTVLLRGINDSPEILAELFHSLVSLGVKPGYLFQCDLAPGTSHFRVPLARGLEIWNSLRELVSGLSLPVFAVDLPGGGGKYPLSVPALADSCRHEKGSNSFSAPGIDGKVYTYRS